MQQRYVMLHYHIFKNGGSTIDSILERNFPGGFATLHRPGARAVVGNDQIVGFVRDQPQLAAVSSHQFRLPFPTHSTIRFVEIAFLRHPLDRLQSMYHYYRRIEDETPEGILGPAARARELSLGEWLRWMLDAEPFNMISGQTAYFGAVGAWGSPPTQVNLTRAQAVVQGIRFLGVVERFDESLVAAEQFLRVYFPALDCSYQIANARSDRTDRLEHRLDQMRVACGDELYDDLCRRNHLDVELWASANRELDRRLAYIPRLDEKLARFRARCRALAGSGPSEGRVTSGAEEVVLGVSRHARA